MAELAVFGPEPMQRWRRPIPTNGETVRLGRAPRNGWAVPWDALISREHAELQLDGQTLRVRRLEAARNPVYYQDVDTAEFLVNSGELFRIGRTTFQLITADIDESSAQVEERSFNHDELKQFAFSDADLRLEVLSNLPMAISQTTTDEELAYSIVQMLLEGIPNAEAVAVVQFEEFTPEARPKMMRWDSRCEDTGRFMPSRRLMLKAFEMGQGILHIWHEDETNAAFTVSGSLDWAFCMPFRDESSRGWCLYASGQQERAVGSPITEDLLKGDLRFAELITEFISSIRRVRLLSQQQAGLSQFFSPTVLEALREQNSEAKLEPQVTDITVLFCDVRGFSKKSEEERENLSGLLVRVSDALGVMTNSILRFDGVIEGFQGDAALGFWGWPAPREEDRLSACRAALQIHEEFQKAMRDPNHSLSGFKIGIGVAYGRAIAGRIGTSEQIKVGTFGPTVNLGSRLEGMTKQLRAPILIDGATADYVRKHLPVSEGRIRRIGLFRPVGMTVEVPVNQLLPPFSLDPSLSDADIVQFESAVDAFIAGRWSNTIELLNQLPVHDRVKDYMLIHIAQNNYEPPSDWNGVIQMQAK